MPRCVALGLRAGRFEALVADIQGRTVLLRAHHEGPVGGGAEAPGTLRGVLRKAGTRTLDIAAPFPAAESFFRRIEVPFTSDAEIRSILPFQIEPLLPCPIEDVVLADAVCAQAEGRTAVLVAAARKEALRAHLKAFAEAGADPVCAPIDLSLLPATARSVHPPCTKGVWGLVHLEEAWSGIALLKEGRLQTLRYIQGGGGGAERIGAEVARTLASAGLDAMADGILLSGERATEETRGAIEGRAASVVLWALEGGEVRVPPSAAILHGALLHLASPAPDALEMRRGAFAYARRIERLLPSLVAAQVSLIALGLLAGASLHLEAEASRGRAARVRDWHEEAWANHFGEDPLPAGGAIAGFRARQAEFAEARPLGEGQTIRSSLELWRSLHESLTACAAKEYRVRELRLDGDPQAHLPATLIVEVLAGTDAHARVGLALQEALSRSSLFEVQPGGVPREQEGVWVYTFPLAWRSRP
ncbi:MAG: hypothetical protein HY608_08890 [Planctomycetes bacterium]|nr:hypothetical protein [Planctomycetota bacterium]